MKFSDYHFPLCENDLTSIVLQWIGIFSYIRSIRILHESNKAWGLLWSVQTTDIHYFVTPSSFLGTICGFFQVTSQNSSLHTTFPVCLTPLFPILLCAVNSVLSFFVHFVSFRLSLFLIPWRSLRGIYAVMTVCVCVCVYVCVRVCVYVCMCVCDAWLVNTISSECSARSNRNLVCSFLMRSTGSLLILVQMGGHFWRKK